MNICCLCGAEVPPWYEGSDGYGNNPEPIVPYEDGRCCEECNTTKVIPVRMGMVTDEQLEDMRAKARTVIRDEAHRDRTDDRTD